LREEAEVLIASGQPTRIEKALAYLGNKAQGQMFEDAADVLPIGRVGSAEDVASAYLFLMTSGFATGQAHVVNGGALLI
jgi:NAD(P)-dependent dehydrogenase (short-subunit alcohol dehydrogenase family)